jgi:aspartate/methionine/tyrosine aminotransferase
MGNVATMGFVYKRLGKIIPKDKIVVATVPYYPSIIKTISDIFPNLKFVSSLLEENEIKDKILAIISSQDSVGIIHLTNFIGVEGRVYSTEFFKEIASEAYRKNIFIVIDEGLWYDQLIYPDEIALPNVIRLVSPSKKYGIPGMKLGFLIADPEFIASYYEEASSGYGGPASMFFLLLEFLMLFEYVYITGDKSVFSQITNSYPDIDKAILADLFEDYCGCISQNHSLYRENKKVLEKWLAQNTFVKEAYILNGLNFFVRIESRQPSMYAFFEELIKNEGVSVMPSSCFGDINDQYVRISILEDKISLKNGLDSITRYLNSEAETPREASRPMREQSYTLM